MAKGFRKFLEDSLKEINIHLYFMCRKLSAVSTPIWQDFVPAGQENIKITFWTIDDELLAYHKEDLFVLDFGENSKKIKHVFDFTTF